MKRLILAALAATALTTSANALDLTIRYAPPQLFFPGANARIINLPEPVGIVERQARDAAIARWTEHCQPAKHVDAFGVTRLSYKYPGCEFGEGE